MSNHAVRTASFLPTDRLIMVVGNYGSGKTEVAVNMAIAMARDNLSVSIADLDIVNPYFRCREAHALMEAHGIRVVIPPGAQAHADLPIIVPEIKGMIHPAEGCVSIFDVGGDPVGAKLLSSFEDHLAHSGYELWQVINSRRPFTQDVTGCLKMREAIEDASRLKVTGYIANSHLVSETTPEVIIEGYALAGKVSKATGRPVVFVTAMEALADHPALRAVGAPIFRLARHMLPPWIRPTCGEENQDDPVPAARTVPLGRRTTRTHQ